jgi:hypothetical protein
LRFLTDPRRAIRLDVIVSATGADCACGSHLAQGAVVALRQTSADSHGSQVICVQCALADLHERSEFMARFRFDRERIQTELAKTDGIRTAPQASEVDEACLTGRGRAHHRP